MLNSGMCMQVACVLMFHLEQNEFPVDTHVRALAPALHLQWVIGIFSVEPCGWLEPKALTQIPWEI